MSRTRALILGLLLGTASAQSTSAPLSAVERQATTLGFGDFNSHAEWTYPAGGASGLPAVVLIAGSSPADLDFTVQSPDGQLKSHIFLDLANFLSARGIAVLRYNKHYVSGPGQVDYRKFYTRADLHTFLADASSALSVAERNPRVDRRRIFLYGWSEGSTVAAALARVRPEVAGLIVQGPVVLPWRQAFEAQFGDVQLPYLRQLAPDGLNAANLASVQAGPGGQVARGVVSYLLDPTQPKPTISPLLDLNGDGTLQLDSEVVPGMKRVLDLAFSPQGFFSIYSPQRALPTVTQEVPRLKQPLLVLQGENDANTPAKYLPTLQEALTAAGTDASVKLYPGLGHSLGPASSPIDDDFRPIAAQPMQDAADWILAH